MSKIEKLTAIRNKIIDELVTKETIKKAKEYHTFKDNFLKSLFKILFLKPFKLKERKTADERFFINNNGFNDAKMIAFTNILFILFSFIFSSLAKDPMILKFSSFIITIMSIFFIAAVKFEWNMLKDKIKQKFNPQNLEKIKKDLFNDYNEKDINLLLGGNLSKKELIKTLAEINKVINKDELLSKFETLKTKKSDDITEIYNLISTIDKIIDDLTEKEKEGKESKIREINRKNLELLENETKKEQLFKKEVERVI